MKLRPFLISSASLLCIFSSLGQNSLKEQFTELENKVINHFGVDSLKAQHYASAYLKKAKEVNDTLEIANGYHLLIATTESNNQKLVLADSLLEYSQFLNTMEEPGSTYYMMAEAHFYNKEYSKSLDRALKANSYFRDWKGEEYYLKHLCKLLIAIIRNRVGQHREAIDMYKESIAYFKNYGKDEYGSGQEYRAVLFGLSESYMAIKRLDSADHYIRLGEQIALNSPNISFSQMVYARGEFHYHRGDYAKAIPVLKKSNRLLQKDNDPINLAQSHFWLAMAHEKMGNVEMSIKNFRTIDSIFSKTLSLPPMVRPTWTRLLDHSRREGAIDNVIHYSRQLGRMDSILNRQYVSIPGMAIREYDLPITISEKDLEISQKEKGRRLAMILLIVFLSVSAILYVLWTRTKLKKRKLESAYLEIKQKLNSGQPNGNEKKLTQSGHDNDLTEETREKIAEILSAFEQSDLFLKKSTTLRTISDTYKTNTRYLSKYINSVFGVSAPNYINNLRIDYALKMYSTNERNFRAWKVSSIAEELGFSSSEYYIKAFKKHTGMKPDQYLARLLKDLD